MKYSIRVNHDFGNVPQLGSLDIFEGEYDDPKVVLGIIQEFLDFPHTEITIEVQKEESK